MPSNSNYNTALEGVLVNQITAAATTATVKVTEINGIVPTWETAAHRITIIQKTRTVTKVEVVDVASGTTQSGSTVTLGTLTRGLPLSGSGFTGTGTPQVFTSGADVIITWDAQAGRQTMFKDIVNTVTGAGAIRGSSTTVPLLRSNPMTTAQRTSSSAANGDEVYDTDLGQKYDYVGGAWAARAAGVNSNGSTTVAGKFEEATVAEQGTATATGATGARLVPAVANLVKTSSGAGDENKGAVLNASGQFASGFLGTGTPSSSNFLRGDRSWAAVLNETFFGDESDGTPDWSSGATLDPTSPKKYITATLPVSQTLTISPVNSPLILLTTGNVTINGTLDLNAKGGAGGAAVVVANTSNAGTAGASILSAYTNATGGAGGSGTGGTIGAGGGGGGASTFASGSAGTVGGGGGGGAAGSGGASIGSTPFGMIAAMSRAAVCGGGGTSGTSHTNVGSAGAAGSGGGAAVWLIRGNLSLGAASIIRANGSNGSAGTNGGGNGGTGGGGGGAGGHVYILVAGTITNSGVTLTATAGTGGTGGTGANSGGNGGAGAAGKIFIYSLSTGTLVTA